MVILEEQLAERIAADPLDRGLIEMLGRERVHEVTVQRVNRLFLFCLTRWPVTIRQGYYHLDVLGLSPRRRLATRSCKTS